MDGLELINRVRKSNPELPIIVMTSRADIESGQKALRLGVSDYMEKPLDHPAEVQAAARRAVQNVGTRDLVSALNWELTGKATSTDHGGGPPGVMQHLEGFPRIPGYRIREEIGRGAIGTVYKAYQVATERTVALKVLSFRDGTEEAAASLLREINVMERLQHPNIIRGFDAGLKGGFFYAALEYVEGENLSDLLDHEGALPVPKALDIARQVANALMHAWEVGLVHRDVKPHNIILTEGNVAKLADLGISRDITGLLSTITSEGVVVGTPLYISPEQVHGGSQVDWRSDVYGLGATLYHMVCGEPPFDRDLNPTVLMEKHVTEEPVPASRRNQDVTPAVSLLIEKMMRKKPEERFASAEDLLMDFERVSIGLPLV
jgi:serine/threonine-protein kinase